MESQRMWLVTPIIGPRRVLHDTILCGYKIPKNSTVIMNAYSVNMDPKLFPEPEIFKPERFIENERFRTDENVITFGKGNKLNIITVMNVHTWILMTNILKGEEDVLAKH